MEAAHDSAEALREQIYATETQLQSLKDQLAKIEAKATPVISENVDSPVTAASSSRWPLSEEEYRRYGRQMIVSDIGIQGQLHLKNAKVLLVGAGGLGCPAAAYLAGAGVGTIGLVDGDVVETSNLHRQILHSTSKVGMLKVESAVLYLKSLNPNITYNTYPTHLTPQNSSSIVSPYDLVLDCTDHPTSRYLISDICILLQKPLISASALRTDGQLIVLNSPPLPAGDEKGGPCYRCVFPKPPPADSVVSCGDGGILGPVVGVMGVLQALEAIKLIVAGELSPALKTTEEGEGKAKEVGNTMLLFSSNSSPQFRSLKMRSRRKNCFACSGEGGLSLESLNSGSLDYVLFCGVTSPINILQPEERVEANEYEKARTEGKPHLLLDVREKVQFDICSIEGSVNVPFSMVQSDKLLSDFKDGKGDKPSWLEGADEIPIYVVCRLGNDSQVVARKLMESGFGGAGERYIGDIRGGLKEWKKQVDASWPEY